MRFPPTRCSRIATTATAVNPLTRLLLFLKLLRDAEYLGEQIRGKVVETACRIAVDPKAAIAGRSWAVNAGLRKISRYGAAMEVEGKRASDNCAQGEEQQGRFRYSECWKVRAINCGAGMSCFPRKGRTLASCALDDSKQRQYPGISSTAQPGFQRAVAVALVTHRSAPDMECFLVTVEGDLRHE